MQDAANLEERYNSMLADLKASGTKIVRYGRDSHTPIETAFQDFGLKILGPTREHLLVCAEAIAQSNDQADQLISDHADAGSEQITSLYRALVSRGNAGDGAEDRPCKGAALNNQSIILKLKAGTATALLAADMQFAKAEVTGLSPMMKALRQTVAAAGPYKFIKLTHHASYNGLDQSVLDQWPATKAFAHTGGLNDATHPDPGVLNLLESHTNEIKWARTDRNGMISVSFRQSGAVLSIEKGSLNDATQNGDAFVEEPETLEASPSVQTQILQSSSGITEVSCTAKLGPDVTRLTVTFDITRANPPQRQPQPRPAPTPSDPKPKPAALDAPRLAPGRKLPPLLFLTNSRRLALNIGNQESAAVLRAIRDAGQTVYDVQNPLDPYAEIRPQLAAKPYKGVVILGGYDVLPSRRLDALPPSVRKAVGQRSSDADNFIVWNDEGYSDLDGDLLPELPVSRIPDAHSAKLVYAALAAMVPTNKTDRFGIRNIARPFASGPYGILPGKTALLVSKPKNPKAVGQGKATASHVYVMLHGSDSDTSRFWGEDDDGATEAMNLSNVPKSFSGVVLAGCCWGALTVTVTASHSESGKTPAAITPESSMALSWLEAGAQAFIGCTGSHYSPTEKPYNYFGGPMHEAFWKRYTQGESPAAALFGAKLDYMRGIPHGRETPNGQSIEFKILKQFTCLGLGW